MTVQLVTTENELLALEADWNELSAGLPMRSWDWHANWWQYYGLRQGMPSAERQLYVLAVYEDNPNALANREPGLIGIAPWYLDRTAVSGGVLQWLGSGEVCTDHLSLLCRDEHLACVASAIAEALTTTLDDWDRLDLAAVDADDEAVSRLVSELEERECIASSHSTESCWVLDLPESWEDYLGAISKSHRKQLRQLERRVLESDRVRWRQVRSLDELAPAWEVLVDLHQRRRRSLGEPGCFASRRFVEFHRAMAERMLAKGALRLSWLELDGTPTAAEYHFADASATYAYQGGVDPDRLIEEPGRLSTILCLRAAIEEGKRQFDFLRGDETYKAHWRATPRPTRDYRIVPKRRLARLRGRVVGATDAVSDWVRQGARLLVE